MSDRRANNDTLSGAVSISLLACHGLLQHLQKPTLLVKSRVITEDLFYTFRKCNRAKKFHASIVSNYMAYRRKISELNSGLTEREQVKHVTENKTTLLYQ